MSTKDEQATFQVDDAQIIFRNFSGKTSTFNQSGQRQFSVVLTEEVAEQLRNDGWNVKYLDAREEGETPTPFIGVTVSYKIRPPRVVMITSGGRTNLDESTIEVLDWADIAKADLICNAYEWEVGDKSGIKAYLKTLFVTIEEDALERKYAINAGEERKQVRADD